MKAELCLEKYSTFMFCKATAVTHALRAAVNEELQIAKIHLCGYFKVTINKFLKNVL